MAGYHWLSAPPKKFLGGGGVWSLEFQALRSYMMQSTTFCPAWNVCVAIDNASPWICIAMTESFTYQIGEMVVVAYCLLVADLLVADLWGGGEGVVIFSI